MKKTIALLMLFALTTPAALAATLSSEYGSKFDKNATEELPPITVLSENAAEVTAQHGINLIIGAELEVLWNDNPITLSGTAVDNGKISATLTPSFSQGYKVLHLPVTADFAAGEKVTLNGVKMRVYRRNFSPRFLGMDLNGDKVADVQDINAFEVEDIEDTDLTPPYPVTGLSHTRSGAKVTLTWVNPPDYDFDRTVIQRTIKRGATTLGPVQVYANSTPEFIDMETKEGDKVTYTLTPWDFSSPGASVTLEVDLSSPQINQEEPEDDEPVIDNDNSQATLTGGTDADLSRLFAYTRIRYQIKCLPSGKPAQAGDSACLWAKIDLVYTQERLDRNEVKVTLTEANLDVIRKRLAFSSQRYDENCIEAASPASYCAALGKALARADYFLEQ